MFALGRCLSGLSLFLSISLVTPVFAARQQTPPSPPQQQQPPRPYEPTVGMPGKDAVWVPTHPAVVESMLDMANVTSRDVVVDLGSGDGRTVIAAARRGAKAVGFEFNPELVEFSRKLAKDAGVADKATFIQGDMYEADFRDATVLALFLLPSNLEKLKDKILALKPGSRVVVNTFTVPGWEPDDRKWLGQDCTTWCEVKLHIVPAQVAGAWRGDGMELDLSQSFQKVLGTITAEGTRVTIENGLLRGDRLAFSAGGRSYVGQVDGDRISGTATTTAPNPQRTWTVTRKAG
jgi:SAM-dependent methyltransferase